MAHILSIIAKPDDAKIESAFVERLAIELQDGKLTELAANTAYEISISEWTEETANRVRDICAGLAADINTLPSANRRKKLLIADMDSTIIEQECIDELAEYAGKRAEITDITERAMGGELDFEAALIERVAMLEGLSETVLAECFEQRISLTPGAKALVQTMNAKGAVTVLVSGGFTFFADRVAAAAGFQHVQANRLVIKNGVLTGEVEEPILGRAAKQNALLKLAGEYDINLSETLAVGDGANDLAMLERAGLGVAFRAKPAVAEMARARIDHSDLTALLYLQGIPQNEVSSF